MTTQLTMTGDDWLSDGQRKRTQRAEARRAAAAITCAKRLEAAAESLSAFLRACNDCGDGSGDEQRGISDGRHRLIADLMEYSTYLEGRYGRG